MLWPGSARPTAATVVPRPDGGGEVHRDREHVPLVVFLAGFAQLAAAAVDLVAATQANGTPAPTAPVIIAVPSAGLVMNSASSGTWACSRLPRSAHQAFDR
jgi:hypothetical protein